jgi:hypothetical protein
MAPKSGSEEKKKIPASKEKNKTEDSERATRILNTMMNTSIVLMSAMMGGMVQSMVEATGEIASEMVGEIEGEGAGKVIKEEMNQKAPEVEGQMKEMISDVRKDIYSQMAQKREEIEPLISDPVFDLGPLIVERYDFGVPKLTEELEDSSIAVYVQLLTSEDQRFSELFHHLTDWLNSLPKLPDKVC